MEQGIKAIPAQLALEHLGAAADVLLAVAALVPLADAIAGRGGGHEVQPIQAGMGRLGGDHLDEIAVLEGRCQGAQPIVDPHPLAMVADLGVDPVGEIHGCGALPQAHHIAIGGEHKHLLIEEVFLDRGEVIAAVLAPVIFLPIHQLAQPVEALGIARTGGGPPFLVFPVGGNAVLRHLVHVGGANLHLNGPVAADHRRVQRLVTIGLGQTDVVLEAARDGAEGVMHHRQGPVTTLQIGTKNPQGCHVEDLVEGLLLALHLAPDAIEVLGPATHLHPIQAHGGEAVAQELHRDTQALLALTALGSNLLLHIPKGLGLEDLEGQILEFPLQSTNAKAIGQGGVDLPGFAGYALLLLGLEGTEGAHVVEPVGQLNQHHPDVTGHRQEHPAQVFRLGFGVVREMDAAELGDALHQGPHLRPKMLLDFLGDDVGVLDNVVEEARRNHPRTRADIAQQIRHRDRMNDVGLTGGPELTLVELVGKIERRGQKRFPIGGAAVPGTWGSILDAALQPHGQGHPIIRRRLNRAPELGSWIQLLIQLWGLQIVDGPEHPSLRTVSIVCSRRHKSPDVLVCGSKLGR